ncbi:PREDICTED: PAX-interacting protein 1 [Condylura cristata]|uniref:PAX-interacting protein 1 n=1 Tax=Condylura cristata TaxID=143302 RepID=UPI0006439607|nr:PREDICTED: PAX-interacting protein 1 [Condylura cristata]
MCVVLFKVVQLLRAGKAKEVSYNALASHIISEDGDNPEVGEAREVFDLPVVKPSWVTLSVQCGALLPVSGFSPESCQVFFGVTACLSQVSAGDRSALWALLTFYGGRCQLTLNKECTHLVVPEPKGEKYACALQRAGIRVVTPDWVLDCVSEKARKDEASYHPRLVVYEEEEEEEEEAENENEEPDSPDEGSADGKWSPGSSREGSPPRGRPCSPQAGTEKPKEELMFDDSSDSSPEKQERNLNWTPAEVPPLATARRRLPPGQEPGLINLCAHGGFLLGCVFAVADYPEQMSDKQLLAAWKRIIQAHGGAVDPAFSGRCTHLLCESQVSGVYAQALRERKRCVTAHWLNTVLKRKRMVPPHRALHFPVAFPPGGKPCAQHSDRLPADAWRVPVKVSAELLMGARLPAKPKQSEVPSAQPSSKRAKCFYITPGICPSLSTMRAIVECAGGKVLAKQPSFRKLMEHKHKGLSEIILISCENDLHLCREYFARGVAPSATGVRKRENRCNDYAASD